MVFESFPRAQLSVLLVMFSVALLLGMALSKTNFCTRRAISDWVNHGKKTHLRAWLLAMSIAISGIVIMEMTGIASFDQTVPPYRSSNFPWLEYILGGLLFGVGMTYANGCSSRALVRLGGGNLKFVIVILMIGVTAYFMIYPFPGTDKTIYSEIFYSWTSNSSISLGSRQDLGSLFSHYIGADVKISRVVAGFLIAFMLAYYALKSFEFRRSFDDVFSALVIGLAVIISWYATSAMVSIAVDGELLSWAEYTNLESWSMLEDNPDARPRDTGIQSLSFISTVAQLLRFGIKDFNTIYLTTGVIAVLGVISGSLLWSLSFGQFKFQWFRNSTDFFQHLLGGSLMGVGGILGLGCTIGQGVTGVSTLALGSFLALGGIIAGSAATFKLRSLKH